jgi:hypothetical protein
MGLTNFPEAGTLVEQRRKAMRYALIGAIAAMAYASGCIIVTDNPHRHVTYEEYESRPPRPEGDVVRVEHVHVHTEGCGHYWYNGSWYLVSGHVHGPGCGHVCHDGLWVLAGAVPIRENHVHSATCGHYCCNGVWYYMHGHVHGPGCGHAYRSGIWVTVRF